LADILAKKNKNNKTGKLKDATSLTQGQRHQQDTLEKALEEFNVSPSQIVYLPDTKDLYVAESRAVLEVFLERNKNVLMEKNPLIFRDGGPAFGSEKSGFPLANYHCIAEIQYPSAVHQWISPNDQTYHGRAKEKWRQCPDYAKDELRSSLSLLHFLNEEFESGHSQAVQDDFSKNFWLVLERPLSRADIEASVLRNSRQKPILDTHSEATALYLQTSEQDRSTAEKHQLTSPLGKDSSLNGKYHTKLSSRPMTVKRGLF